MLKRRGNVDLVVSIVAVVVYVCISAFMVLESWKTLRSKRGKRRTAAKSDHSAFAHFAKRIQKVNLPPMIELPVSGIKSISVWAIVVVAFIGGIFSGFLGGGAGYIRMPSMIYVLGIPTHLAV
jgi:uncharacterized membrane protein YfcA